MALSFEESKKQLSQLAATPMMMSLARDTAIAENWRKPDNAYLYDYYDNEYSDDKITTVDDNKNIHLGEGQINLTQEKNSQYIPFELPRYYDGFDLSKTELAIFWVNTNEDGSFAIPVDVYYSDDKIRFAWLIDENVTAVAGNIKFEIQASGTNSKGYDYLWKTMCNAGINVIQALEMKQFIKPDDTWQESFFQKIADEANKAEQASTDALGYAQDAQGAVSTIEGIKSDIIEIKESLLDNLDAEVASSMSVVLADYALHTYVDDADKAVSDKIPTKLSQLENDADLVTSTYAKAYTDEKAQEVTDNIPIKVSELENDAGYLTEHQSLDDYATKDYVTEAIKAEDITNKLTNYYTKSETLSKSEIEQALGSVTVDLSDYSTKEYVENKASELSVNISKNTNNISTLNTTVQDLQSIIGDLDNSSNVYYRATYGSIETSDGSTQNNMFTLWQYDGDPNDENTEKFVASRFEIVGGSGTVGGTSNKLYIYYDKNESGENINKYVFRTEDIKSKKSIVSYVFTGEDSTGDTVSYGDAVWQIRKGTSGVWSTIKEETIYPTSEDGIKNQLNISEYISSTGTYTLRLTVTDSTAAVATKTWTIQNIEFKIESDFNDKVKYSGSVSFDFIPHGAVEKDVHFILYDDTGKSQEIGSVTTIYSGSQLFFDIPAQAHGSHLLEVYMTATINGVLIESNHILKDIIWYDSTSTIPVISTIYQNFTAKQYETTNIEYTVYDPSTDTPTVEIAVNGVVVSTPTLTESNTDTYSFKTDVIGKHIITITCGEKVKTLIANIIDLGINVSPVTTGLVFDFNPVGKSNNSDIDRKWSHNTVSMKVSNNFDWINGGYQYDENGDQYFCIKAGTHAIIDYKLFGDDAMTNGKEMKLVFKTTNVAKPDATFLHCVDDTTGHDHIGVRMNVHEAFIYGETSALNLNYSEEDIIEFEFNINKKTEAVPMVMAYEDGVSTTPMVYDSSSNSFTQVTKKNITLGSDDCDLHIYRFKVYNTSLSAANILKNFIADARNTEEMIARYNRNQIYESGKLDPDALAEKCPWLRIIKIEAPYFTTGKKYPVNNTTIEYIYKNGEKDGSIDYWKCINAVHVGQGTSSDDYGAAGRNLDLVLKSHKDFSNTPVLTLKDGSVVSKVALTPTSIPSNYFNIKVNIASSENANNALLQRRYNEYNPYKRPFVREEGYDISMIKDTMEFYNCVVFVKETGDSHTEFANSDWNFYAIGNIGDSKKTDKTRLTDPDDRYECINEIIDVKYPLSDFPMGDEAIAIVEAEKFDKSGTYEWRYIWEDGTDEENAEVFEYCKQRWIEFYKKVIEPLDYSDEEAVNKYKQELADYVVLDSVLYYYLFTTRYTMVDNRAKNTFWHYGKTGEVDSEGNPIRKWDLAFDYDNDTALGNNNYGAVVYRYGLEDTDVDENGEEVFRESDSTFFCRLRDLFAKELKKMYQDLDTVGGAWDAESLITQFDNWQNEFPEELWREDIERKYIRTYTSSHVNGGPWTDALKKMAHGRKKYHRRNFERNQAQYMASKYQSRLAAMDENRIDIRCGSIPNDVLNSLKEKPNYSLTLTPYSYMYLNVEYSNGIQQMPIKELGEPVTVEFDGDSTDIINIYSSTCLQSLGDLSPCYAATINVGSATKIKELIVGNATSGYDNPYLKSLTTGSNYLLEKLNIENVSGLTQPLNLQVMNNLKQLYAHGSNVSAVTFADGGRIEIAELPAINTLTMKNLMYLVDLDIANLTKLTRLRVENCNTVDLVTILDSAINLNRVRITNVDWVLENGSAENGDDREVPLLNRLYAMNGEDKDGILTDANGNDYPSVLTGKVHVPIIRQQRLAEYKAKWPDLDITYDDGGLIIQHKVIFKNYDDTELCTQYVDHTKDAIDPIEAGLLDDIPTKPSSISTQFTFIGWDKSLTGIYDERIVYAVYEGTTREYTIKYISRGTVLQTTSGMYGDYIEYTGNIVPEDTSKEANGIYYLFKDWDKSGLLDNGFDENGVKVVNAVFDEFVYNPETSFVDKELENLSDVEIYALSKIGVDNTKMELEDGDLYSIRLGYDINYDNEYGTGEIPSKLIVADKTSFDGTNYIDTGIDLFRENRDFVLAIDYEFLSGTAINSVIAQCFQSNGSSGFKLWYNNGVKFNWCTTATTAVPGYLGYRDMMVIRHKAGSSTIDVYMSNLNASTTINIESLDTTKNTVIDSTLVLGCAKADDGAYEGHAIGNVHWCKVWYKDLGDSVCRKLANWTHEKIAFEMCGQKRFYLTNGYKKRCTFSLLATHLLERGRRYNNTRTNVGGWASSDLNTFLNLRLYDAIPNNIKQILKKVTVPSSAGDMSYDTINSECYITIPSVIEVSSNSSYNKEPYVSEMAITNGKTISYLKSDEDRIRSYDGGDPAAYWLRSPNVESTRYVFTVDSPGYVDGYEYPDYTRGVLIEISF